MTQLVETGKYMRMLFADFNSLFNSINHSRMMTKLLDLDVIEHTGLGTFIQTNNRLPSWGLFTPQP